jgi:hypothetical protein
MEEKEIVDPTSAGSRPRRKTPITAIQPVVEQVEKTGPAAFESLPCVSSAERSQQRSGASRCGFVQDSDADDKEKKSDSLTR